MSNRRRRGEEDENIVEVTPEIDNGSLVVSIEFPDTVAAEMVDKAIEDTLKALQN